MLKFTPRLALLIALTLCILAASAGSGGAVGYSDVRETRLDNGLTILTKEVRVAPVVSVNVFYKVGSRNEHTGITGASHLLEHMMFKGTKKYPKGQLEKLVRQRGGVHNAATWTDYTYYWELIQSDYLELMLQLEADRMQNALFDPEDLKSEMVVVRSELEGRENSPDSLLWDLANATAFTAHPYQWPVIGWRSDVEGMTRDDIYGYYRRHYGPNNATIVLVGDFDSDKAIDLVKKHFGRLKPIAAPAEPHTAEPGQRGERRAVLRTAGSSDRAIIAWHIPAGTNPDCYALDVLEQVLSGGRASRMHQALVEKGLATSAWAYSASKTDPSLFYAGATAQQGKRADELEKALMEQVRGIEKDPPTSEELARAKRQIEASFVFSNDDIRTQALVIGQFALTVGLDRLDRYIPAIQGVTSEDVVRVARTYLVDTNKTVAHFVPAGPPSPEGSGGSPGGPVHLWRGQDADLSIQFYRDNSWTGEQEAAAVVAQAPEARAASGDSTGASREMKPERFALENGMVLIVLDNPANPSISIGGRLAAGSWMEEGYPRGTSGFVADMLTRGAGSLSSLDFARSVEDLGASVNFSGGIEGTYISGRCLSQDFGKWGSLFADALRAPSFSAEELDKLRQERLSALEQEVESPDAQASRAFGNRLYPQGHPYHPGTIDEQRTGYREMTRETLAAFHGQFFGPKGMVLVVVGDIRPAECRRVVEEALGDWRAQPGFREISIADVPASEPAREAISIPDKTETNIYYGWPGTLKRTSKDYYAAVVMNDILGGGVLTSRLGRKIRGEMGLVYDVRSGFQATLGAGPWLATLGTNPKNAAAAEKALREIVQEMYEKGPTKAEVEESRQFITGVLSLRLATNSGIASFLESSEVYGLGLDYLTTFRNLYGSVTQEAAARAARDHLRPESAMTVVAGAVPGEPGTGSSEKTGDGGRK